ncbi:hypothetical protein RCZ04_10630 [Capnocytophaga sp. HP1101]
MVLVYPKDDLQEAILTSFLQEKNIAFDEGAPTDEYLQVLTARANEIMTNPETAGGSFDDFDRRLRTKYGF